MKVLRLFWKSLYVTVLLSLVISALGIGIVYFFREKIVAEMVARMNQVVETDIHVRKLSLDPLTKFPYLALTFNDVEVKDPLSEENPPLAKAKKLYLLFNPLSLLNEELQLEEIQLESASLNLRVDQTGRENFLIFKKDSSVKDQNPLELDLRRITFTDVLFNFTYMPGDQFYSLLHKEVTARLTLHHNVYDVKVQGDLFVYDLLLGGNSYLQGKNVRVSGEQVFDPVKKMLMVKPSIVAIDRSGYKLSGVYEYNEKKYIALDFEGEKGQIETLLSLLPETFSKYFRGYHTHGNIYFSGKVKGIISEKQNPAITIDFGFDNTSFVHPETKARIEKAVLKGYFTNGRRKKSASSVLKISKFNAMIGGRPVRGDLTITNFTQPFLRFNANGSFDLAGLTELYPIHNLRNVSGSAMVDMSFAAYLDELKNYPDKIDATGEIKLHDLGFDLVEPDYTISGLNGNFLFDNNDLAINNLSGKVNGCDFDISGLFRNMISALFNPKRILKVEASLVSDYLNINNLIFKRNKNELSGKSALKWRYLAQVDCQIGELIYKKMTLTDLRGGVALGNDFFEAKNIKADIFGGHITTRSYFTAHPDSELISDMKFEGVKIDSLFYAFDNFDQDFLESENLKGQLSGKVHIYIPFDAAYKPIYPRILGAMEIHLKDGELNDFTPMQKLSRFVDVKELYNVRFSELSNRFEIRENQLLISEMQIRSNVSDITLMGTHSFDNFLDYKLKIPLKNFRPHAKDRDEAFGAVENDTKGNSVVFLTVKGPANDFKISYDTKRTRQKINQGLRRERNELSNILENKMKYRQQQKEAQLNQNEYFNFDD